MAHNNNGPQISNETLVDLADQLQAAIEDPKTANIGTLAKLVGRLRGELSLMSNCQDALAYAPTPEGIAWRELLEADATSSNAKKDLTQEQIGQLAAALTIKQSA